MQIKVHYQGLDHTPWMDDFITRRVAKLDRYLHRASNVLVNVRYVNKQYVTSLAIHNPYHDFAFQSDGVNMFESFSTAIEKAARTLSDHKKKVQDKINSKFTAFKRAS
jgi:ribosomal subunit interface protein